MLTAKKSAWFENFFAVYNQNLFKRRFNSLRVCGLNFLLEKERQIPLIIYANHSSWWDGLIAFEISRAAQLDAFVMMEEKQLKRLFPFRFLGAFSVVRENNRESLKSINYAVDLLKENPNRTLWIFPQGKIEPNDLRPIKFYNGVSRIVERAESCLAIPVSFRYEFLSEFKPDIFVKIGSTEKIKIGESFNSKKLTNSFEQNLTQVLEELKTDVLSSKLADYKIII